jgi:predicted DNA-binding protein
MKDSKGTKTITFRPRPEMKERLERIAEATERPLSFFIHKSLEAHIEFLEKKYAKELAELDAQSKPVEKKKTA